MRLHLHPLSHAVRPLDLQRDYLRTAGDLFRSQKVREMKSFVQHGGVSCFEHCLYVSFVSYRICRALGLDSRAAARGGLLHDFFLYDWHKGHSYHGLHAFEHPKIALRNAEVLFPLSARERDIIRKHMWPLCLAPPRYAESFVVMLADKYCALAETFRLKRKLFRVKDKRKKL